MSLVSRLLGKWNPKTFARLSDGVWEVTPAEFYPAMIEHIQKSLANEDLPAELIDRAPCANIDPQMAARRYRNWAKRITPQAWADALLRLEEIVPPSGLTAQDLARLVRRAEALECARLWFTRALKNCADPPICIHISKDLRFRLGVSTEFRA